jgi:hypothetical protein
MPNEEPPFDLPSFLKGQRALAEAQLNEVSQAELRLQGGVTSSKRVSTASATSGGFFVGVLVCLAFLAGFLVLRPPPPPSPQEAMLRKELAAQKDAYDRQVAQLTEALVANQDALGHTQDALRATEKALTNEQQAMREMLQPAKTTK